MKGTLAIKFLPAHGVMLLDPATVANLELVRNLRTGDPHQSLFGALNKCLTQAGSRFLRSALLQPSTDLATISARLDAVSELLTRPEAIQDARKILPTFKDSERLLRHFMQKQTQSGCARAKSAITAVLQLKAVLRTAPLLGAALTSSGHELPQNELLQAIVDNLTSPELTELASHIDTVIDEDASFARKTSQRMLECLFAVRPKVCSFLDVTRQTLGDSTRDMDSLVASYADSLGLTDMKLVYTERRGYHLTLPASQREIVERNGFIRIASHAKRTVACSTEQLAQLNNRCKEMIGQILMSTERELTKLQDSIRQRLHVIFAVGESIALLDTLIAYTSFSTSLSGGECVRPRMGEGAPLVIKRARHPLLEAQGEASVVPNDVALTHATNFQLITGPNMSGKSTYLRQAALITLLAHIGCHVPGKPCHHPPSHPPLPPSPTLSSHSL